jgi:hypothetical protein
LISIVKIGDNSQTCIKVSNYQSHVGSSPANKHTARNYSFNIPKGIANVLPNLWNANMLSEMYAFYFSYTIIGFCHIISVTKFLKMVRRFSL